MVICHCLAVNDAAIRNLAGDPGTSIDEAIARCGAGSRCGGCLPSLALLVQELETSGPLALAVPAER